MLYLIYGLIQICLTILKLYFDSQFPFLGLNNFAEAVLTLASSHRNGKFLTTLGYKDS